MQPTIQTPATLLTQSQPYVDNANSLKEQADRAKITDPDSFANATDFVKICQGQLKSLEDARKAITQPLNDHVKWINDQFRPIRQTIEAAKKTVSDRAATWKREDDKRIREEAETARKAAEEQAIKDAEEAVDAGDQERADKILDVAATTPAAEARAPTARGALTGATGGTRETWKGEVKFDDIQTVCRAIADGQLPTNLIKDWNKTVMNGVAKNVGKSWPDEKTEDKHHGLTIKRETGLNVR